MPLERLLILCIVISSCNTTRSRPVVEVETCVVDSSVGGAQCVSSRFPDGWQLELKSMDNYVCFSPWDAEKILHRWVYE